MRGRKCPNSFEVLQNFQIFVKHRQFLSTRFFGKSPPCPSGRTVMLFQFPQLSVAFPLPCHHHFLSTFAPKSRSSHTIHLSFDACSPTQQCQLLEHCLVASSLKSDKPTIHNARQAEAGLHCLVPHYHPQPACRAFHVIIISSSTGLVTNRLPILILTNGIGAQMGMT